MNALPSTTEDIPVACVVCQAFHKFESISVDILIANYKKDKNSHQSICIISNTDMFQ